VLKQVFTGRIPLLLANQWRQSSEGNNYTLHILMATAADNMQVVGKTRIMANFIKQLAKTYTALRLHPAVE